MLNNLFKDVDIEDFSCVHLSTYYYYYYYWLVHVSCHPIRRGRQLQSTDWLSTYCAAMHQNANERLFFPVVYILSFYETVYTVEYSFLDVCFIVIFLSQQSAGVPFLHGENVGWVQ